MTTNTARTGAAVGVIYIKEKGGEKRIEKKVGEYDNFKNIYLPVQGWPYVFKAHEASSIHCE
jgi:hypothetical protein